MVVVAAAAGKSFVEVAQGDFVHAHFFLVSKTCRVRILQATRDLRTEAVQVFEIVVLLAALCHFVERSTWFSGKDRQAQLEISASPEL